MNSIACDRECFEQWRAGEAEISPDPLRADFTIRLPYHRSHFLLLDAAKAMEEAGREPLQPSCVLRAAADDLAQVERVLREFSGLKDPLADAAGDAAKKVRAVVAEIVEAAFAGEDRVH